MSLVGHRDFCWICGPIASRFSIASYSGPLSHLLQVQVRNYHLSEYVASTNVFLRTCVKTNEGAARKFELATSAAAKASSMKQ